MNSPHTLKIKLKLVAAEAEIRYTVLKRHGEIRVSAPQFAVRRTICKGSF